MTAVLGPPVGYLREVEATHDVPRPNQSRSAEQRVDHSRFEGELLKAVVNDRSRAGANVGGNSVQAQRTPLSAKQASELLGKAYEEVTGKVPSEGTLSILTAHWAHETGNGAAMYNFNFGGIKGTSPEGLRASYKTREGFGESEKRIVDHFRAYTSAQAGASDYMRLLANRFPEAVQAAQGEDPGGFVSALKERSYFTGDERAYTKNLTRLANQAMAIGFDGLGGETGPVQQASSVPYFSLSEATTEATAVSEISWPFDNSFPIAADPAVGKFWDAFRMADEVNRAALRIAADRHNNGEDS